MDQDRTKDWRELCKAAASELDPAKLITLVSELTRALDERDQRPGKIARDMPDDKNGKATSLQSEPAV